MAYFVKKDSIVRKIWGDGDTILFIFAGASAEFALNKAVDWLYFTGKLPTDPLGRLFSTVAYARKIVFSDYPSALKTIDQITAVHQNVEKSRGDKIPDWAYRDVLFMLIDYSIRSYEILKKPLNEEEKTEVFEVFNRVGFYMGIGSLPANYEEWKLHRANHLQQDLACSPFTHNLYQQYAKHLGYIRYQLLIQAQGMVCPKAVLLLRKPHGMIWLKPVLTAYNFCKKMALHHFLREIILPKNYKLQIQNLDVH